MELKINDELVELQFGFKFLNSLNKEFKTSAQGMEIDAGLMNSFVAFKSLEPISIFKIVKSAVAHLPKKPTDEKLYTAMEDTVVENYDGDFDAFCEDLKEEMGKRPIIKASIEKLERTTAENLDKGL